MKTAPEPSTPEELAAHEFIIMHSKRGGPRPNSGRPALPPEEQTWRLSIGLKPINRYRLAKLADKRDISMAAMINVLVEKQAELDEQQEALERGEPKSDQMVEIYLAQMERTQTA